MLPVIHANVRLQKNGNKKKKWRNGIYWKGFVKMRLIDADLLKQNCKCTGGFNDNFMCVDLITLAQVIDNQPTAFDTEKVVEQLEEERELSYADFDRYVEEVSQCLDAEYDDFFHRGLERAIKIVKGGGIDAEH